MINHDIIKLESKEMEGEGFMQGVYAIRNKVNDRYYIGKSYNIEVRIRTHLSDLFKGKSAKKLQTDYDLYGKEFFEFEILEIVKDRKKLLEREQFYICQFDAINKGYNSKTAVPLGSNSVSTNITDDELVLLKEMCKLENVSVSSWVKEAIREKLERIDAVV